MKAGVGQDGTASNSKEVESPQRAREFVAFPYTIRLILTADTEKDGHTVGEIDYNYATP